jgi:hypothetical protein
MYAAKGVEADEARGSPSSATWALSLARTCRTITKNVLIININFLSSPNWGGAHLLILLRMVEKDVILYVIGIAVHASVFHNVLSLQAFFRSRDGQRQKRNVVIDELRFLVKGGGEDR